MRKATIVPKDRTLNKESYKAIDRISRQLANDPKFIKRVEQAYTDMIVYGTGGYLFPAVDMKKPKRGKKK